MPALATVDGKPWDYPDSLLDMMLVVKLIARSQHDFEGSENEARAVVAYMRTFWQVEIVTPEAAE